MRVERVIVRNYRGAIDCDVNLTRSRNVAVMAGTNGSGKTSLIEACRCALGEMYGLRPLPAYPFQVDVSVLGDDGQRYVITRTQVSHIVTDGRGVQMPFSQSSFASRMGLNRSWYFTSWRDPRLTDGVDIQTTSVPAPGAAGEKREETLEWVKNFLVRWDVSAQFNKDPNQIAQVTAAFERLSNARNLFFPERSGRFVSQSVGAVLSASGYQAAAAGREFKFDLYLSRDVDHRLISLNDLSSGELEVFCFLGVLVLSPQLDVVYIDEPELHLNPQWHRMLLGALQTVAPHVQFLVATHSEEIWSSVYPDQRFYIREGVVRA